MFREVNLDLINNKFSLVTEKEMEINGVFTLGYFTSNSACFMDVFKKYDGIILAYDNELILTTDTEDSIDLELTYCVTCY